MRSFHKFKKNKKNIKHNFSKIFELPEEIILDIPKITAIGTQNVIIENFKSVLELSSNIIKVNSSLGIIKIAGENLIIKGISIEDVLIEGNIKVFEFLT